VLALLGILGQAAYRGASQNIRNLLKLAVWCGGAAMVAGALFGSYFGLGLLPPLWFN